MKLIKCDVCGQEFGSTDPMIEMVIPGELINDEDGTALDVCSWPCVSHVVNTALSTFPDAQEPPLTREEEEEAPEDRFLEVPLSPSVQPMDEKTLREYTEAVTGVKRR